MSVGLTAWTMSTHLPSSIDLFDIVLGQQEVVLDDDHNESGSGPFAKLEGVVRLHLSQPLQDVRAISFRFVAGAVAKYDNPTRNVNLRGPERLVDRTISLWERDDPDNSSVVLEAEHHEFAFALRIPGHMPPSLKFARGHVQYILVASVEWDATICGFSLPFYWRDPLTVKREVPVRRIPGKVECVMRKLKDIPDADEKRVRVLLHDEDGDGGREDLEKVSRAGGKVRRAKVDTISENTGRTVWAPIPELEISIPTRHPTGEGRVPVTIDTTDDVSIVSFSWTLRQHAAFEYAYNMPARGVLDSPNNSIVPKQRDELHVLRQAFSYVPKPSSSPLPTPNTTHHSIHVPLLDDIPEPGVELVQDVETTVMEVRHFVRLQVTYRLRSPEARPSGSDVDTDLEVEAEIELPIVLYEAPSESTSCDTEAAVLAGAAEDESPLASGGGFVEEDEEEEEPPAYVDTGRPPVYSGDGDQGGVRRRRF